MWYPGPSDKGSQLRGPRRSGQGGLAQGSYTPEYDRNPTDRTGECRCTQVVPICSFI